MIILGLYAKNGEKISKNDRDFVNFKIFWQLCQISVIDIKCPSFGQMSIFWGLVFCKQLYIYVSNNLWNKNWGSLAVMGGSFLGGPLFEGVRGGDPPTFSEFFFRQKLLNWHIWKVKRFRDFQNHRLRSTTRFPEGGAESAPPPWEVGLKIGIGVGLTFIGLKNWYLLDILS